MVEIAMPILLVILGFFLMVDQADASESCSEQVQRAVEEKLRSDFPAEPLIADAPDISMVDGGSEYFLEVPVRRLNDKIAYAMYSVLVGETCQVLSVELKR